MACFKEKQMYVFLEEVALLNVRGKHCKLFLHLAGRFLICNIQKYKLNINLVPLKSRSQHPEFLDLNHIIYFAPHQ